MEGESKETKKKQKIEEKRNIGKELLLKKIERKAHGEEGRQMVTRSLIESAKLPNLVEGGKESKGCVGIYIFFIVSAKAEQEINKK